MSTEKKEQLISYTRVGLIVIMVWLSVWLCGCGLMPKDDYQGKRFFVLLSVFSEDPVYSLSVDLYQNGELVGTQNVCNADGSKIKRKVYIEVREEDLKQALDEGDFSFGITLSGNPVNKPIDESDTNYQKPYKTNVSESFVPKNKGRYDYVADGDFQDGFSLMTMEAYR